MLKKLATMYPKFRLTRDSINDIIAYYHPARIADFIYHISGKPNYQFVDETEKITYLWIQGMAEEIYLIAEHVESTVINKHLYDLLEPVFQHPNIQAVNKDLIYDVIEKHNANATYEFEALIKREETEFFDPKPKFIEPDIVTAGWSPTDIVIRGLPSNYPIYYGGGIKIPLDHLIQYQDKRESIHCVNYNEMPNYLDPIFIPKYLQKLETILYEFRSIVKPYIELYNKGMIGNGKKTIAIEAQTIKSITNGKEKLKVNVSVEDLACIFHSLWEMGIIESPTKAEMIRFIADNLVSKRSGDTISLHKLEQFFSSPPENPGLYLKELVGKAIDKKKNKRS